MPVFVDTNVVVYAFGQDPAKVERAEAILADHPTFSVQAINAFLSVCRVKHWVRYGYAASAGWQAPYRLARKPKHISSWHALIAAAAVLSGSDAPSPGRSARLVGPFSLAPASSGDPLRRRRTRLLEPLPLHAAIRRRCEIPTAGRDAVDLLRRSADAIDGNRG